MESVILDGGRQEELVGILAGCPLFRALRPDHFPQILKAGELIRYAPGEPIIEQGAGADSFYVSLEGETSISVDGPGGRTELGRVPHPNSVGEVGLLLHEKPDGPGASAGLQRGDLILEVNTCPAAEFTPDDMRSVFCTDGRHALAVERGGKRVKLTLELKR